MGKIFINSERQMRSGWKIAITLAGALLTTLILSTGVAIFGIAIELMNGLNLAEALQKLQESSIFKTLDLFSQSIAFIFSSLLFWKIFDRKSFKLMGLPTLRNHRKDFVFGLLLGILSIALVFLILYATDMIFVANNSGSATLIGSILQGLFLFIFVGFSEEIFSRGYCMSVLKQTKNKYIMVLVSSVLFSLLHGMNPNITFIGFLNIFLIALLFAYMFIKTDNLWIPIGYHITWNFFQGNIFGFPVSGIELEGLYKIGLLSDNIWNGGKFGAEGGLITTIVIILGFVATKLYSSRA